MQICISSKYDLQNETSKIILSVKYRKCRRTLDILYISPCYVRSVHFFVFQFFKNSWNFAV